MQEEKKNHPEKVESDGEILYLEPSDDDEDGYKEDLELDSYYHDAFLNKRQKKRQERDLMSL